MSPPVSAVHARAPRPVTRILSYETGLIRPRAVNDNAAADGFGAQDHLLKAALRHFAAHGLGAAREARRHAERAFFAGDSDAYGWWASVCRALDRRLAAELGEMLQGEPSA